MSIFRITITTISRPSTIFFFLLALLATVSNPPAAADEVIQIEAEDLSLTSYVTEDFPFASNGKIISLLGDPGSTGSSSGRFTGDEGDYIVVINYLDEDDGNSRLSFEVNGKTIETDWPLDQLLGANQPDAKALTAHTLGPTHLKRGDTFTILGKKSENENTSLDFIQFIPATNKYQAEEATLSPGAVPKTDRPGFTGTGYVETTGEGTIEWTVNATVSANGSPAEADYSLEFRYAYDAFESQELPLEVYVNDKLVESASPFRHTGAPSRWQSQAVVARLENGSNTIRIQTKDLTDGLMANIDYLSVTKVDYLKALGSVTPHPDARIPETNDPGYAESYYGCVDPEGKRSTLSDWKQLNEFDDASTTVSANYINAFDLGFGRKMSCKKDSQRTACYVDNFLDPKGKSNFAATVVMERMEPAETCSPDKSLIAFFAYDKDGQRINKLALDSEGPKSIPESCYTCHGGGSIDGIPSDKAQFLPWNLELYEDWPGQQSVDSQAENFRALNDIAWTDIDRFGTPRIKSMIESWYDGRPLRGTHFNGSELFLETEDQKRVPKDTSKRDWFTDPKGHLAPDNTLNKREESLYTDVYAPYCRACHTAQTDDKDWNNAADFNQAAYNRICEKPESADIMPHAELTDQRFKNDIITDKSGSNTSETTALQVLCEQKPGSPGSQNTAPGRGIFSSKCTQCHRSEDQSWKGNTGPGSDKSCRGSSLTRVQTENDGIPDLGIINPAMSSIRLDAEEVNALDTYLNSFDRCGSSKNASGGGSLGGLMLLIAALGRHFRRRFSHPCSVQKRGVR